MDKLSGIVLDSHKPVGMSHESEVKTMKKLLLFLLAMLVGISAHAATATPTPNATQTAIATNLQATQTAVAATATYIQTAFPTLTPTLTPTGTLTPSPTFTPAPRQLKDDYRYRLYFQPQQFTQADGITALGATPLPGSASAWLAQSLSETVAVLSTGTAEIRLGMTVPWNYRGNSKLFLLMNAQSIADSVTLTVGVNGQSFNCTTVTVGTYSYFAPSGGVYYMAGTATQVVAGFGGQQVDPLWDTPFQVVSRVLMPLNAAAAAYADRNPSLGPTIQAGDILNFDIKRTSGGNGNVYIYSAEFQYDNATLGNP